jgi:hypothetical protein
MRKLTDDWLPTPRILIPGQTNASPSTTQVGAACGNSARADLCGGRSAMIVPTAIQRENLFCDTSKADIPLGLGFFSCRLFPDNPPIDRIASAQLWDAWRFGSDSPG